MNDHRASSLSMEFMSGDDGDERPCVILRQSCQTDLRRNSTKQIFFETSNGIPMD